MKSKLTERHQAMAYVLKHEFGYTQKDIASLMKVNQSTISNAIKEFKFKKQIQDLSLELKEARDKISQIAEKGIDSSTLIGSPMIIDITPKS
ncbi:helix-turn-helix domain-containing protein [Saccharibacillus kuerlensis]|uniref:ParB/Spo0J HTH domain-containing protein n=1 Tax=Saccharibacillus kuerlensis TaxID=459527 RepID=A0ABQ2KVZ4_9BACL|nr:helix-turn-helix domain-containing protein [Saccharibacillus kuerlensis]GGN95031.1 hypothetical protein GCM10010969_10350 [Saccharibacillus kuerlensis]